jgi:hypothetical protein|eukprot:30865-Pelagococcus_subviridis.AAC.18
MNCGCPVFTASLAVCSSRSTRMWCGSATNACVMTFLVVSMHAWYGWYIDSHDFFLASQSVARES